MQKERATQIRQNWIETACTKTKIGTNKMQISSRYEPLPWLHGTEDGQQGAIWIHNLIIKFNAAPSKCITILLSYRITFQHFRWKCALSTYLLILLIDCCRQFILTDIDFSSDALHFQGTALIRTEHIAVLHRMFVYVLCILTMKNLLTAELLKLEWIANTIFAFVRHHCYLWHSFV